MRDSPLAIAEAALYLKGERRKLKIRDPYSLTPAQLAAAGRVLAEQRPYVGEYWELPPRPSARSPEGGPSSARRGPTTWTC